MTIEIKNVSCGYSGVAVVKNICISTGRGELWCVLGPNGVGKTTLFKTVLGLLKPLSGSITIDGLDLCCCSRKELAKKVAYVPQSHVPPFPFSVEEIIAMGRNPYQSSLGKISKVDKASIDKAIDVLNIGYLRGCTYTKISGGERQLVLLARAIAQETPIMILDEPVANLDFGNQARVIEHICKLAQNMNKTVVMTTHFPDHSFLPECNVILLQKNGKHCVGKGRDVVTEEAIHELYQINNRIVDIKECNKCTCVPMSYP